MDALAIARRHPAREVVFFGVGFETTAPANAMAVWQARREGLTNFSMLVSHVLVPPAIRLLLASPRNRVQGFIAPGHVCTVMGYRQYESLAHDFRVPGRGGLELVIRSATALSPSSKPGAEVLTMSIGHARGRLRAQQLIEGLRSATRSGGIGLIPDRLLLAGPAALDAELRFGLTDAGVDEPAECVMLRSCRACQLHDRYVRVALYAETLGADGARRRCLRGLLPLSPSRRSGLVRTVMAQPTWPLSPTCPAPLPARDQILLGHGSGGTLSAALVRDLFLPAFANPVLARLDDQASVCINGTRLAFTTDSFVVKPLFFPGGDIGSRPCTARSTTLPWAAPLRSS
jgi:hypothetical protein